jgi:hypothetical protein
MIDSLLRRASLAAAAAMLSFPAAAQSDAAFVSALSKPLPGLATMAEFKTRPQIIAVQAKAGGPSVPQAEWRKMMESVRLQGKLGQKGDVQALHRLAGDPKGVHKIYSAMVFLEEDLDGELFPFAAALKVILYVPIPGTDRFEASAWTILLTVTGEVTGAEFTVSTGNRTIGFTKTRTQKVGLADPALKARVDEIAKFFTTN